LKKEFYQFRYILIILLLFTIGANGQSCKNKFTEWTTWTLLQAVPSPVFYNDQNPVQSRFLFGFRWQVTPLSYCFNVNKFVSPVSVFKVNPLRRHSGSVELLAEPDWTVSDYKYSDLKRFSFSTGVRGYIPLQEYGEYLSASVAVKYNLHKNKAGTADNYPCLEAGIYSFFGILGLKFNYNFSSESKYNIGFNLKYY